LGSYKGTNSSSEFSYKGEREMTEEIWARKPRHKGVVFDYGADLIYPKTEMDDWLAEVKQVLIDDRETIHKLCQKNYAKRFKRLNEKIKSIKAWGKRFERVGLPTNAWNEFDEILGTQSSCQKVIE